MKKTMTTSAKCTITAILSVIMLIALANFAIGAVNASDTNLSSGMAIRARM